MNIRFNTNQGSAIGFFPLLNIELTFPHKRYYGYNVQIENIFPLKNQKLN